MKKLKITKKVLSITTSGIILINCIGCSNNKSTSSNIEETLSSIEKEIKPTTTTEEVTTTTTEGVTSTSTKEVTSTITEETTTEPININLTENDEIVLEHFKAMGDEIKKSINNAELLEKGKSYFVYCVDFLFYDGEIKGIKFADLSDKAKQQLLSDINTIDELICSKYPNYKETISATSISAYNKASEIIKAGSINIKDFRGEKLGEENYNKILEINKLFWEQCSYDWDTFKDLVGEGSSYVKTKLDEWYQNNFKD
ncbi:MAG: hypothetical protein J6D28_01320 [Bacilli bacterium]|nr:hypothetical protein [Bacilli bacterium]